MDDHPFPPEAMRSSEVAERRGLARDVESVRVHDRDDDRPGGVHELRRARVPPVVPQQVVGELDRVLGRRPLTRVMNAHDQEGRLAVSGVLGGTGQANYAAANAALDALARVRTALGLPATSMAWGLWDAESEMASGLSGTDVRRIARGGILPLSAADGLVLFDAALDSGLPAPAPVRLYCTVSSGAFVPVSPFVLK